MSEILDITIDWKRCVFIDGSIDETMLSNLIPKILEFRQESNSPITLAINSNGGSLSVLDSIDGLLRSPNQDGERPQVITVVTNQAYSAAAMMLALGDYAVGMTHSKILFHDVRYGGLDDVTPSVALNAAKKLQLSNENASLRLASQMFGRWMWNYIDLSKKNEENKSFYPDKTGLYNEIFATCELPASKEVKFDPTALALSIFVNLDRTNECLIDNAMSHLKRWAKMTSLWKSTTRYKSDSQPTGLLDKASEVFKSLNPDAVKLFGRQSNEDDLSLLIILALGRLANQPRITSRLNFEKALSDFSLLKSINDSSHVQIATKLMLRHRAIFFDAPTASNWPDMDKDAKEEIMKTTSPSVQIIWLLCLLVARELFNGEHELTPREALILGLLDEVPGTEDLESRRQFRVKSKKKET